MCATHRVSKANTGYLATFKQLVSRKERQTFFLSSFFFFFEVVKCYLDDLHTSEV